MFHFSFFGALPNLVLVSVILLNFFEKQRQNSGILAAAIAGFYLDVFSDFKFGVAFFALIVLAFLVKKILKPIGEENIFYFVPIFILLLVFYNLLLVLFGSLLDLTLPTSLGFCKIKLLELLYNLGIGTVIFCLVKSCFGKILRR